MRKSYATTNSMKLTGLSKDSIYNVKITAYVQGDTATVYSFRSEQISAPTKPSKVTGVKYKDYDIKKGSVSVTINKSANATGYKIRIYDCKTVVAKADSSSYKQLKAASSKLKKYKYFNVKVSAYVTVNGKKVYGDWSNAVYVSPPVLVSGKNTSKGISIKWGKVSGATNYSVYVSNKPNSGYKLFKTISKNSITINKFGKKSLKSGSNYYLYVVANKKVGKTTYKNDAYIYNVKYKK